MFKIQSGYRQQDSDYTLIYTKHDESRERAEQPSTTEQNSEFRNGTKCGYARHSFDKTSKSPIHEKLHDLSDSFQQRYGTFKSLQQSFQTTETIKFKLKAETDKISSHAANSSPKSVTSNSEHIGRFHSVETQNDNISTNHMLKCDNRPNSAFVITASSVGVSTRKHRSPGEHQCSKNFANPPSSCSSDSRDNVKTTLNRVEEDEQPIRSSSHDLVSPPSMAVALQNENHSNRMLPKRRFIISVHVTCFTISCQQRSRQCL